MTILLYLEGAHPLGCDSAEPFCAAARAAGHRVVVAGRLTPRPCPSAGRAARVGLHPRLAWLDFPLVALQLVMLARREGCSVVHAHPWPWLWSAPDLLALRLVKALTGARIVAHYHNHPRHGFFAALERPVLRGAVDAVIVSSERSRDDAQRLHPWLSGLLRVVHNAPAPARRPFILSAIRVTSEKGIDVLLFALRRLVDRGHDVDLAVCGHAAWPPPPFDALSAHKALAAKLGLGDRVRFWGRLDRTLLHELLQGCRLFVLPSRWESHSFALLEAMSQGAAIVATRVGGAEETITDAVDGLLVPPSDPDALAAAMERLMSDEALRARLGRAALERARDFSWERYVEGCLRAYGETGAPARVSPASAQR